MSYQGESLRLSLENCDVIKKDDHTLVAVLHSPSGSDGRLITVTLTQLKSTHVALAGFDMSPAGMLMRPPTFAPNSIMVAIPYGLEVRLIGMIDLTGLADTFNWPGDNAHQAILNALYGMIALPEEVVFKFLGLELDCSRLDSRVVRSLKILGVWPNVEESEDVPGAVPPNGT